ncbi:hypothetical protein ES703_81804 [subsurface metagenome]
MQNQAAEIKAGEMLADNPDIHPGGNQAKLHDVTLPALGITRIQSHRWQLEAEIPEENFEQFIAETKAATEELTSRAALSIALKFRRQSEIKNVPPLPAGKYQVIYADPLGFQLCLSLGVLV